MKGVLTFIILFYGMLTEGDRKHNLLNESVKFWDAEVGYGFSINAVDSTVQQYYYDRNKVRVYASYGDVIITNLKWELVDDTLWFKDGSAIIDEMTIESITDSTMTVYNTIAERRVKYFRSFDQNTSPLKEKTTLDIFDPIQIRTK